eukprot:98632_1
MIHQRNQGNTKYHLGEYLPRNLSQIPSYNVSLNQFVRFTNFQGIGLVKTLYLSAIIFVTAYSILLIMKDWIAGDSTKIIIGLVFTSIFWFVSLILLRVVAECIISLISVSHLIPILQTKIIKPYKKSIAMTNIVNLTRIKREEDKEQPNFDIHQNYNIEQKEEIIIDNKKESSVSIQIEIDPNEWNPYKDTTSEEEISVQNINEIQISNSQIEKNKTSAKQCQE